MYLWGYFLGKKINSKLNSFFSDVRKRHLKAPKFSEQKTARGGKLHYSWRRRGAFSQSQPCSQSWAQKRSRKKAADCRFNSNDSFRDRRIRRRNFGEINGSSSRCGAHVDGFARILHFTFGHFAFRQALTQII